MKQFCEELNVSIRIQVDCNIANENLLIKKEKKT